LQQREPEVVSPLQPPKYLFGAALAPQPQFLQLHVLPKPSVLDVEQMRMGEVAELHEEPPFRVAVQALELPEYLSTLVVQ
jgi:hypothetical protein